MSPDHLCKLRAENGPDVVLDSSRIEVFRGRTYLWSSIHHNISTDYYMYKATEPNLFQAGAIKTKAKRKIPSRIWRSPSAPAPSETSELLVSAARGLNVVVS
ncbi:hypothetical protein AMECASPLE_031270 [Ameca splendens]|uniref:Uncharacterized protein n=1 Tax=Ameca splendens TaxID=208324 RepID=A0ABV0ZHI8_9TELE